MQQNKEKEGILNFDFRPAQTHSRSSDNLWAKHRPKYQEPCTRPKLGVKTKRALSPIG